MPSGCVFQMSRVNPVPTAEAEAVAQHLRTHRLANLSHTLTAGTSNAAQIPLSGSFAKD